MLDFIYCLFFQRNLVRCTHLLIYRVLLRKVLVKTLYSQDKLSVQGMLVSLCSWSFFVVIDFCIHLKCSLPIGLGFMCLLLSFWNLSSDSLTEWELGIFPLSRECLEESETSIKTIWTVFLFFLKGDLSHDSLQKEEVS